MAKTGVYLLITSVSYFRYDGVGSCVGGCYVATTVVIICWRKNLLHFYFCSHQAQHRPVCQMIESVEL